MQQFIVFSVIFLSFFLFVDGRIRYDFVALMGLLILVITGIIKTENAFVGFSHPAVITVASVLVISSALIKTGAIDHIVIYLNRSSKNISMKILSLTVLTALISAFMNNVGALALIMPVAITVAKDSKVPASQFLMPVAFASLLGGMMTEIGTPPNLIISSYRAEAGMEAFGFFDFAPVGIVMVILGIAYIVLIGYRFIPHRISEKNVSHFKIEDYLSEALVTPSCKMVGKTLRDFYLLYKIEVNVIGIIRNDRKIIAPLANEQLLVGDVLIVKAVSADLAEMIDKTGLVPKGAHPDLIKSNDNLKPENLALVEVVLREDSPLIGRNAMEVQLRNRFNVNLIAISRKGASSLRRMKTFRFRPGDILLIQTPENILQDTYNKLRCLPLAERGVQMSSDKNKKKQLLTALFFGSSILLTTIGLLPVQVAFASAALLIVISGVLSPRDFYDAIEWPTIIMLGSLLQYGGALQSSGGSDTIAQFLMKLAAILPPAMTLSILMVITMVLTNLINNSAAAVLMAPVALSLAQFMGVSADPLLMSVCVASSSAFMTPIGHQSNMLVMGPGGYKFTDYSKLGFPITLIILFIGAPLILKVWPL